MVLAELSLELVGSPDYADKPNVQMFLCDGPFVHCFRGHNIG